MLLSAAGRDALMTRVLDPLVRRYGRSGQRADLDASVLAYEFMNEPDWVIEEWERDLSRHVARPLPFEVAGELSPPDACHCAICRRWSGHYWASTDVARDRVKIEGGDAVSWFQSSEKVRRGFCRTCGSVLFFDPPARDWIAIAMGAFDPPTGTRLAKHIFVADKGDYYEIGDDGLPRDAR